MSYQSEEIIWKVDEDTNQLRAYHAKDLTKPAAWAPQPGSQVKFLTCPIDEVLLEGNRGGGKTDVLLMDYVQHVGKGYGKDWNGILFRRTYKELDDVRLKSDKWFTEIFPTATFNKSANVWTFKDGEKLRFAVADTITDYNKYHGHAYTWMAFEELTNWPDDKLFKKLMSLSRSSNANVPKKVRATTNPSGPGHNWIRKRYGLPSLPGQGQTKIIQEPGRPERIAIQSRLDENKVLLHADPNYINKLLEACDSPEQERAWVYGDWDITSGGMFDDVWLPQHHILQDFPIHHIPEGWRIDRSYDHGQSKPFSVGFWAQSNGERMVLPDGRVVGQVRGDLIRIEEWYGCNPKKDNTGIHLTAKEIAQGILDRVEEMGLSGRMRPGPADASIFDQVEANKSVAGDMKRLGIKWLAADKAKGSRKQGWQQVRTLLKQAIPQKSEDGNYLRESPGLFVTDRCVDFIRTVPVLSRDKKDVDDVDTNIEDHIADEMRYRCRARLAKRTRITKG